MTPRAGPRLLLLLGQSAFDPTSGAAQAMRQAAELLAHQGWMVRALCTSACEGDLDEDHAALLARAGHSARDLGDHLELEHNGVAHQIVRVAPQRKRHWERDVGVFYAGLLEHSRDSFQPQICLTFGGDPGDETRRRFLRQTGARVVFAPHNLAYLAKKPRECDAFLAPSRYLAERYRAAWGQDMAVLPTPLMPEGVIADRHEPVFVTFLNPEPAKGLALVARLAERLGRERPDIPLLVVEGRAKAGQLLAMGRAAGVDLSRFGNLMFAPSTPRVADIWGNCRLVLVPSLVHESAGRVAVEAMANGAVPLVSDRGALPETVGAGGIVLPLPRDLDWRAPGPVDPAIADPWFAAVLRLVDDEAAYAARSQAARAAAQGCLPPRLGPRYDAWFRTLLAPAPPSAPG